MKRQYREPRKIERAKKLLLKYNEQKLMTDPIRIINYKMNPAIKMLDIAVNVFSGLNTVLPEPISYAIVMELNGHATISSNLTGNMNAPEEVMKVASYISRVASEYYVKAKEMQSD